MVDGTVVLDLAPGDWLLSASGRREPEGRASYRACITISAAGEEADRVAATSAARLLVDGASLPLMLWSVCHRGQDGSFSMCDTVSSAATVSPRPVAAVMPARLLFDGPQPEHLVVAAVPEGSPTSSAPQPVRDGEIVLDLPAGVWNLWVSARWSEADVRYWLPIRIT